MLVIWIMPRDFVWLYGIKMGPKTLNYLVCICNLLHEFSRHIWLISYCFWDKKKKKKSQWSPKMITSFIASTIFFLLDSLKNICLRSYNRIVLDLAISKIWEGQKRPVPKNFKYYFMSDFHGLKFNIGSFVKINKIFSLKI
jgi:hypothetical protein